MKSKVAWLIAHAAILAIACAVIYLLVYNLWAYRGEAAQARLPVKAVQSARAERWKTALVEGCPPIVEYLPTPEQRRRLNKDFGRTEQPGRPAQPSGDARVEAPPGVEPGGEGGIGLPRPSSQAGEDRILGLFDVPPMRRGGEALATLPPSGRLELTFRPAPPRFLDFRPVWGGGVWGDALGPSERFGGYGLWEPVVLRERWHLRVMPGFEQRSGEAKALIPVVLEWRSRPD